MYRTISWLCLALGLFSGCADDCPEYDSCADCVREGCVWITWQDGATECASDTEQANPADSTIAKTEEACPQ